MNKFLKIVRDFIPNDKGYIKELSKRYINELTMIGQFLEQERDWFICYDVKEEIELIDFLDGNGFLVERPKSCSLAFLNEIKVIPIYKEVIIDEEENEEPINNLYISVYEETLYATSMEMDIRPILEYQKLPAPREIWFFLCRRMEHMRLVSESRGRSDPLPRPP